MSDYIRYDYDSIDTALDDINARFGVLMAQAEDIRAEQTKIAGYWEDEKSATAYQAVQTKWNDAFGEITSLLGRVRGAASEAVTAMRITNDQAATSWQV
jgi:WXG100 family type VII secretion target